MPEKLREGYTVTFQANLINSNKNNNSKHFYRYYYGLGTCHLIDNLTVTVLFFTSTKRTEAQIGYSNIPKTTQTRKWLVPGFLL